MLTTSWKEKNGEGHVEFPSTESHAQETHLQAWSWPYVPGAWGEWGRGGVSAAVVPTGHENSLSYTLALLFQQLAWPQYLLIWLNMEG